MNLQQLTQGLTAKATGDRENPPSPWMGALYVFAAMLFIALAALPAILARRKAAKLAHKLDLLEEEQIQVERRAQDENFEDQAKEYIGRAKELEEDIKAGDAAYEQLRGQRGAFKKALSSLTSWEDLE